MRRRLIMTLMATTATVAATILLPAPASFAAVPTRIMPLGDSITGSPGCWRAMLWNDLKKGGYTNLDFVGTQTGQGCGQPYDSDGEGHGGFLVTDVAKQNMLPSWLSSTKPDIVLMHFATNDVWNAKPNAEILAAYSKLVDQMRASNAQTKILVAKIIPLKPTQYNCPECPSRVVSFNNAIPAWATAKSTTKSPITVVDQWTDFNPATDTADGVHPNERGNQKMAERWYEALTPFLATNAGPGGGTAPPNDK